MDNRCALAHGCRRATLRLTSLRYDAGTVGDSFENEMDFEALSNSRR